MGRVAVVLVFLETGIRQHLIKMASGRGGKNPERPSMPLPSPGIVHLYMDVYVDHPSPARPVV